MARKPRVEYSGALYHVMCRGNRQEPVFRDAKDCECFLDTLGEASNRCGWLIHAFVLMGNHYHLLMETPEANLVVGMKWLQGTYTQRFNARHQVCGHLFQGRYKALLVDGQDGYFTTVANYIHLNPARAKSFNLAEGHLSDYRWSSHTCYLHAARRPEWLRVERVLSGLGFTDDPPGRTGYRRYMHQRVKEVLQADDPHRAADIWDQIRRGWVFGSDAFRSKMEDEVDGAMGGNRRDSFSGEMVKMHDEREASRLLSLSLKELGISEADLGTRKKSDDAKSAIAWLIRTNTSVSNEWISSALRMGHPCSVSRAVRMVNDAVSGEILDFKHKISIFKD